ncbi:ROK family protein [Prosthecomicrobium pneumaticum]|uniref:Putative NBD/HSP70 family sugar kinase n=1 Tax=Prosthecomicrobium pneumaticum TaxID=81895 RepID=A0A7W9FQK6_9HYPH|nr:putative NBD/HSP70 family sugar kinase [Prosthecomicrobium pneumaticum]
MQNKADTELVRRQNRGLVLAALRRSGPLARVELGEETGLSPATISAITGDLIAEHVVVTAEGEERSPRSAGRGRPRVALALNPEAAYVLGVNIVHNHVTLVLADFAGRARDRTQLTIDTYHADREAFGPTLGEALRSYLAVQGVERERIAEVSIAAQGVIDASTGRILWSPAFAQGDVPVSGPVSEALGIPSTISNDVDRVAQALNWQDPKRFGGTFAVIFIAHGVGMGMFIEGKPFGGAFGAGAEFGHVNHIPGGALCRCGRHGCLEAYVADYAIYRTLENLPPDLPPTEINPEPEAMRRFEERAKAGDERARLAYRQAGLALGYGLARLIAIINPERVVLTGSGLGAFGLMEDGFNVGLEEGLVPDLRRLTRIEMMPADFDLVDVGILASALQRLDREVFAASDHRPVPKPSRRSGWPLRPAAPTLVGR